MRAPRRCTSPAGVAGGGDKKGVLQQLQGQEPGVRRSWLPGGAAAAAGPGRRRVSVAAAGLLPPPPHTTLLREHTHHQNETQQQCRSPQLLQKQEFKCGDDAETNAHQEASEKEQARLHKGGSGAVPGCGVVARTGSLSSTGRAAAAAAAQHRGGGWAMGSEGLPLPDAQPL